jgi:hypothetical protein
MSYLRDNFIFLDGAEDLLSVEAFFSLAVMHVMNLRESLLFIDGAAFTQDLRDGFVS